MEKEKLEKLVDEQLNKILDAFVKNPFSRGASLILDNLSEEEVLYLQQSLSTKFLEAKKRIIASN